MIRRNVEINTAFLIFAEYVFICAMLGIAVFA